jgi:Eco57I restriction-modification methylase
VKRELPVAELKDAVATADALFSLGLSEALAIASGLDDSARSKFGRGLCAAVLDHAWSNKHRPNHRASGLRQPPCAPSAGYPGLVKRLGEALLALPFAQAGFLIGQLYTALLPDKTRKTLGAFYTPPPLVARLLDSITAAGFDWKRGRVVDPACGGAAFLGSLAPRLVKHCVRDSPAEILSEIEERLLGIEVDPFAAWISMVLLDMALSDLTSAAGRPLKSIVLAADALQVGVRELGSFDLVIGNPPYGRVTLTPAQRRRFKQSLFGHANLYGLFTELAVDLLKPGGLIAYVTPTSFLGGEYFKNLRKLLETRAPLQRLDFVTDRDGVFDGVLQETMLAVYQQRRNTQNSVVQVAALRPNGAPERLVVDQVGPAPLSPKDGAPWLLPRSAEQVRLLETLTSMPHRLADYGFQVSTGQLVWNRHKHQLRRSFEDGCLPIIWAEAVSPDGKFHFQAARRFHLPYIKIKPDQDFLVNQEPCILVQRTTAKEQKRRIIATLIPNSFVLEYPGFVVENHLNMVYSTTKKPKIALHTLAALLNSAVIDQAFRCINGSVAVSAYELNSLPFPAPEQMQRIQDCVFSGYGNGPLDSLLARLYSQNGTRTTTTTARSRTHDREMAA